MCLSDICTSAYAFSLEGNSTSSPVRIDCTGREKKISQCSFKLDSTCTSLAGIQCGKLFLSDLHCAFDSLVLSQKWAISSQHCTPSTVIGKYYKKYLMRKVNASTS